MNSDGLPTQSGDTMTTLTRDDYKWAFDPYAYLNAFYSSPVDDSAMTMVLSLLPTIAARLPHCQRLLDIGSGPTVHVPVVFRKKVDEIYLSDYLPQNRELLRKWLRNGEPFDWSEIVEAKTKVQSVLDCDVLSPQVIESIDIAMEYSQALSNVIRLLKIGGYLVLGGILSETWYQFGGRRFGCYLLLESELFSVLSQCGMDTREKHLIYYNHCDVFLLITKRIV
uniref:Methyltransferase type 11 domain-containing protein n=1 Tax=Trichuris muris TaxID=70415 RepID=A0A5S6R4Q2_TRIMR